MRRNQTTSISELLLQLPTDGPVHRRLSDAIRAAVQRGQLQPGDPMPPSRRFADDLGVSRWVVTEAYEQLVAEGYLVTRPGSGTRVATRAAAPSRPTGEVSPSLPHALPRRDPTTPAVILDLRPGRPDLSEFPRPAWVKAYREAVRRLVTDQLGFPPVQGLLELRTVLAAYLRRIRGIDAAPEQILITRGTTHGMRLLSRVLAARGAGRLAVEDPGWPQLPEVAADHGLQVTSVQVDAHGLDVAALPADTTAVLVTPAHQFPTGVGLSTARRTELLQWAAARGGLVIEDDYDAEFRYDHRPFGALAGLDSARVAYLSSVSKTLAPALRLGWTFLPDSIGAAVAAEAVRDPGPSTLDQIALAQFISSGGYDRHLRRMRRHYRERRDALASALQEAAPELTVRGVAAGLHLLIDLTSSRQEATTVQWLAQHGILVMPLQRYQRRVTSHGIVVNYAQLPTHLASGVAQAIKLAITGGRQRI
jgi:GntR family transcriptional regulator / MocR family aminotransferase